MYSIMSILSFFPLISHSPPTFLLKTIFLVLYLIFVFPFTLQISSHTVFNSLIWCSLSLCLCCGRTGRLSYRFFVWSWSAWIQGGSSDYLHLPVTAVWVSGTDFSVFPSAGSFSPRNDLFQYGLMITLYFEKLRVTFLKAYWFQLSCLFRGM